MIKRIFTVEDKQSSLLIAVKAESAGAGAKVYLLSDRLSLIDSIAFSNGAEFEKTAVNDVIALHFDISNGIYVRIGSGGKFLYGGSDKDGTSAKKIFDDYEKNNENEKNSATQEAPGEVFYDDYKIAEENYFKLDDEKDDNTENDDAQRGCQKEREEKRFRLYPFEDDEDRFACKKQDDRNASRTSAEKEQSFHPLYERGDQKEGRGRIERLLSTCPKETALESVTGGRFARAKDEGGKEFIVGIVKANEKIYQCVGFGGEFSSPPEPPDDWFFIPKSPFNECGAGYWLIFADSFDKRLSPDKNTFG